MKRAGLILAASGLAVCGAVASLGGLAQAQPAANRPAAAVGSDPVHALVGRLDLQRYKTTIKSLTQFGDRRQGTARNRAAIDWIETQLKSYGCATERLKYEYLEVGRTSSEPRVEVLSPEIGRAHV